MLYSKAMDVAKMVSHNSVKLCCVICMRSMFSTLVALLALSLPLVLAEPGSKCRSTIVRKEW
jgi:hypothetical protein